METHRLDFDAGFLIVKTFPKLYEEYLEYLDRSGGKGWGGNLDHDLYAVARLGKPAQEQPIRYRGLYRDALSGSYAADDHRLEEELEFFRSLGENSPPDWFPDLERRLRNPLLAEVRLQELDDVDKSDDEFIFDLQDSQKVLAILSEQMPTVYELIWTKVVGASSQRETGLSSLFKRVFGSAATPPKGFRSAGYDPTWFYGDHFSASCDCMMFPRWHGTDEEGVLFKEHFEKLNPDGLFRTESDAREFLDYYLSFDWTEHDEEYSIAEVFLAE